jgi:hypothetical protein
MLVRTGLRLVNWEAAKNADYATGSNNSGPGSFVRNRSRETGNVLAKIIFRPYDPTRRIVRKLGELERRLKIARLAVASEEVAHNA